jgi:hypothetical protein
MLEVNRFGMTFQTATAAVTHVRRKIPSDINLSLLS